MHLFIMFYYCLSFPAVCHITVHSMSCYYLTFIKLSLSVRVPVTNGIDFIYTNLIFYVQSELKTLSWLSANHII